MDHELDLRAPMPEDFVAMIAALRKAAKPKPPRKVPARARHDDKVANRGLRPTEQG